MTWYMSARVLTCHSTRRTCGAGIGRWRRRRRRWRRRLVRRPTAPDGTRQCPMISENTATETGRDGKDEGGVGRGEGGGGGRGGGRGGHGRDGGDGGGTGGGGGRSGGGENEEGGGVRVHSDGRMSEQREVAVQLLLSVLFDFSISSDFSWDFYSFLLVYSSQSFGKLEDYTSIGWPPYSIVYIQVNAF